MMQVTSICSKCQNEIEHGKENYLQLIDRNNTTYYAVDKVGGVVVPTTKWEYCLCPKCFKEFNSSVAFPYKEDR